MDDMQCGRCGAVFHPASNHDECPVVRRVHEAMQNAPHDGILFRHARAAVDAMRLESVTPPVSGNGWVQINGLDRGYAWQEIREFGGFMYGRMRLERGPAVFVSHVDVPARGVLEQPSEVSCAHFKKVTVDG